MQLGEGYDNMPSGNWLRNCILLLREKDASASTCISHPWFLTVFTIIYIKCDIVAPEKGTIVPKARSAYEGGVNLMQILDDVPWYLGQISTWAVGKTVLPITGLENDWRHLSPICWCPQCLRDPGQPSWQSSVLTLSSWTLSTTTFSFTSLNQVITFTGME